MFCSSCGKTIHATDEICPHCGATIGESRFGGTPYTSAQPVIAPNQTSFEPMRNYTRTTYTRKGEDAEEDTEVDSRTTYRPVYDNTQSPRKLGLDKKEDAGADADEGDNDDNFTPVNVPLSRQARETLDALEEELKPDEEIDRSQFVTQPPRASSRAGISRDVSEYIRQLEDSQARKASARHRRRADYDDYSGEQFPQDDGGEQGAAGDGYEAPPGGDDSYVDDGGYQDYEPYDGYDDSAYDRYDKRRSSPVRTILSVIAVIAAVALLVVGITAMVRHFGGGSASSPIEGVSQDLYTRGIELLRSHTAQEYVSDLVSSYTTDGMIVTSQKLQQGKDAISALLPEQPDTYDQAFVDALLKIEDNIGNAVLVDGITATNPDVGPEASAESESNWQTVNSAIDQLEAAKSYTDLSAIIQGASITVQSQTPEPTATVASYGVLSKGDENNDVMKLQVRLYNLGYLNDTRDGVYGSNTATAVGLFQQRAGLPVNGNVADNATQVALFADDAPYAAGHETPEPTAAPTPEATEEMIQPAEADGGEAAADQGTVV